jgi:hypothetical protein
MHPTRYELEAFILDNLRDSERSQYIREHLEKCEFCREMVADFEEYLQELKVSAPVRITPIDELRINLKPLAEDNQQTPLFMAADGEKRKTQIDSACYGTYYSEKPELVLRVMRSESGGKYLQLMGDDPESYANVMVRLPELDYEFMTDATGCADISGYDFRQVEKLSWQVKLPEAVFSLEPLDYDPEKLEYENQTILETERDDKIEIRFEGKAGGKQLSIRILKLEGKEEYTPLRILVAQNDSYTVRTVSARSQAVFDIEDPNQNIKIRLFQ